MDIVHVPDYNALRFSGCSQKFANYYSKDRLYAHGLTFGLAVFPIVAQFEFAMDRAFDCPLQLLTICGEFDYESFTSLN